MIPERAVLLVESDAECGRALARLLRRDGHRVRLVRTARAATGAVRREAFDLAVVDLLLPGGGPELGRRLARRVPRLYLSIGARLAPEDLIETALGFPVLQKATLPGCLGTLLPGRVPAAEPARSRPKARASRRR